MPAKPHRKRVRHFEGRGHLHELTFSCYRRMPLITNDVWRRILGRNLASACGEEQFDLVAFVFMPEHVHLLVRPASREAKVGRFLARTKQPTSKAIKQLLIENQSSLLDRLTVRERATDWKWSSARYYIQEIVDLDLPRLTPPSVEWFNRSGVQTEHS